MNQLMLYWADIGQEAKKTASIRVADILNSPDKLVGSFFDSYKQKMISKVSSLDIQVKTLSSTELEEAKESISLLGQSLKNTETVRSEYVKVNGYWEIVLEIPLHLCIACHSGRRLQRCTGISNTIGCFYSNFG
jgi:hypothetical protein